MVAVAESISVIIPALNEAGVIAETLQALQPVRAVGEIIVVDGGSHDRTADVARPLCDRVIVSPPGRAMQMNHGARHARGRIFWFVHADTLAPRGAADEIQRALRVGRRQWGRFDVRLSGRHPLLRVVERMMNLRSHLSGIATGDQGIFVRRTAFDAVEGFPEQPLMEDIAISRRLRRISRPARARTPLLTSSRRWETHGVLRTILLMWYLRAAYALGASPARLARRYK